MAVGQGYFSVSVRDGKQAVRNVQIKAQPIDAATLTVSELSTLVLAVANRVQAMVKGEVVSAGYFVSNNLAALAAGSVKDVPNADVEEGAIFLARGDEQFKTEVRVPTFSESLLVAGTRQVDMSATAVQNFVAMLENTLVGWVTEMEAQTLHGDGITDVYDAYEQFKASGRRRR